MKIIRSVHIRLILGAFLLLSTTAVWSSTVYTYTGNNFDTFDSLGGLPSHDASMSVTVALEYTNPLSFNLTEQPRVPISFSISDGINTIDNTTASSWNVRLGTDALGQINSWFVYAVTGAGDSQWYIETINSNLTTLVWDYGRIGTIGSNRDIASIRDAPGSWTVSPIPVPAAVWLFGTALIGLVGFGRRRRAA